MRILIVDGHSVIFAWEDLRKLHARRTVSARERLVKLLTAYQDSTSTHVVLVFDGKGDKASDESAPGGIQVFYSSNAQTADDIIERLVARYASEHEITVATDDTLEQSTVLSLGANWMTTDMLRVELETADADFKRRLDKHRKD